MNKRGFTLIELLVVITIIAILSVIVFVSVTGITRRARNSSLSASVREAGSGINVFRNAEGVSGQVITLGTGELSDYVVTTGTIPWAMFTGTMNTVVNSSGTFSAVDELQYPTSIVKVPSPAHAMHYSVLLTDGTDVTYSSVDNRGLFSLGTSDDAGCVIFSGDLVADDSGQDITSFYRNGSVAVSSLASADITCTNP